MWNDKEKDHDSGASGAQPSDIAGRGRCGLYGGLRWNAEIPARRNAVAAFGKPVAAFLRGKRCGQKRAYGGDGREL